MPSPTLVYPTSTPDAWSATGTAIYVATYPSVKSLQTPTNPPPRALCDEWLLATPTLTPLSLRRPGGTPPITLPAVTPPPTWTLQAPPPAAAAPVGPVVIPAATVVPIIPPATVPPLVITSPPIIIVVTSVPPTATETPLPTATETPLPTATETPLPTATETPLPTAIPQIAIINASCVGSVPSFALGNFGGALANPLQWTITDPVGLIIDAGELMTHELLPSGYANIAADVAVPPGLYTLMIVVPWLEIPLTGLVNCA
jgi:hypothetical protein